MRYLHCHFINCPCFKYVKIKGQLIMGKSINCLNKNSLLSICDLTYSYSHMQYTSFRCDNFEAVISIHAILTHVAYTKINKYLFYQLK